MMIIAIFFSQTTDQLNWMLSPSLIPRAGGRDRTDDPLITSEVLYH